MFRAFRLQPGLADDRETICPPSVYVEIPQFHIPTMAETTYLYKTTWKRFALYCSISLENKLQIS